MRHDLRFFIGRDDGECIYAHGRDSHRKERLKQEKPWLLEDLKRWEKCVNFVRAVNDFFCPPKTHRSVYRSSKLNPLNLISLWKLAHYVFGVSRKFWDDVFVPVHTSTFLETQMDGLPAVIAELLEDIVPLSDPETYPVMDTWEAGNAREVFEKLVEPLRKNKSCSVHTSNGVSSVTFKNRRNGEDRVVVVTDEDGNTNEYVRSIFECFKTFDHVIRARSIVFCQSPIHTLLILSEYNYPLSYSHKK